MGRLGDCHATLHCVYQPSGPTHWRGVVVVVVVVAVVNDDDDVFAAGGPIAPGCPLAPVAPEVITQRIFGDQGRPVSVKHGARCAKGKRGKTKTQRGGILVYYSKFAVIG